MCNPRFSFSRRELLGAGTTAAVSWGVASFGALAEEAKNGAPAGFIDAHVHIWTPDTSATRLRRATRKVQM